MEERGSTQQRMVEEEMSTWQRVRIFWAKHGFAISLLAPSTIYMAFFVIIITVSLLRLSFTFADPTTFEETFPTVANYEEILNGQEYQSALVRTILFVIVGTPAQLIIGLVLALLINKPFRGRGVVRSVFLLPVAIPGLVTTVILAYMLFPYPFGHVNDLLLGRLFLPQIIDQPVNWYASANLALGLALIGKVWRDMPISMLILLAGLQSIGEDQYEAAQTMGANAWQRFWYITIPMLVPAISTVLILRSIEMWKEFLFPYVLAPTFPILGVLIDHIYHERLNPQLAAALGLTLVLFILISRWVLTFTTEKVRTYLVKV